ncbi:MAG: hypothetical protein ACFFCM_10280 [Promethearchaeota archaeon]
MPQPLTYLTKKFAVTNSASECAEIITQALSDFLKKKVEYKKTEDGFHIKARKGLIFDPELFEFNIFPKAGLKEFTVIEVSNGIIPRGFGSKSAKLTEETLQKGIDEVLEVIIIDLNLIGIDQENICLKCGKVNFPMAGFCVKCGAELESTIKDVALKEVSSIVEKVGIVTKEEESIMDKEANIPKIMDRITDIIDGKIDPVTLEEKVEVVSSWELGRCKYCNCAIDEKAYTFHKKGYEVNCKNCDKLLD